MPGTIDRDQTSPGPSLGASRRRRGGVSSPEMALERHSPTTGLLLGLVITLTAVVIYSQYITTRISDLQDLQTDLVDRNRRDSLQLIRIQNDLNLLALAMRDMLDGNEPYPLTAWESQFARLRTDLEDALRIQEEVAIGTQTADQRAYLRTSMTDFWSAVDRMFVRARDGDEQAALDEVRNTLQARQAALGATVARLLVENNESEEAAAVRVAGVYSEVRRQVTLFLIATLIAILGTGAYLIHSNRRVFAQMSRISGQRSDLARALITAQESTLRHIARDLHDEFGQVLTAIGSMLDRSRRHLPDDSTTRRDLEEVRQITQSSLDNVRGMSQALHPSILEEGGLESAVEAMISSARRRNGLDIRYEKTGQALDVDPESGIHVYRVLQEALTNVSRHSGVTTVVVRMHCDDTGLVLEVEDHGRGFVPESAPRGIGLIAMRERAELMGGVVTFSRPEGGGTRVRLSVPRPGQHREVESAGDAGMPPNPESRRSQVSSDPTRVTGA